MMQLLWRARKALLKAVPPSIYGPVRTFVWRQGTLGALKQAERVRLGLGFPDDGTPPLFLTLQHGHKDGAAYMKSGEILADALMHHLEPLGVTIGEGTRVLDFGCGIGRALENLPAGVVRYGCDVKPDQVTWLTRHRPSWRVVRNEFTPPLPADFVNFDLIYAFSVFTHMSEAAATQWATDLHSRLAPKGILFVTVIDPSQERFSAGFGLDPEDLKTRDYFYDAGKNISMLTRRYVESRWSGMFEILHHGVCHREAQWALILRRRG